MTPVPHVAPRRYKDITPLPQTHDLRSLSGRGLYSCRLSSPSLSLLLSLPLSTPLPSPLPLSFCFLSPSPSSPSSLSLPCLCLSVPLSLLPSSLLFLSLSSPLSFLPSFLPPLSPSPLSVSLCRPISTWSLVGWEPGRKGKGHCPQTHFKVLGGGTQGNIDLFLNGPTPPPLSRDITKAYLSHTSVPHISRFVFSVSVNGDLIAVPRGYSGVCVRRLLPWTSGSGRTPRRPPGSHPLTVLVSLFRSSPGGPGGPLA